MRQFDYRSKNHRPWADYVVARRDRVSPSPVIIATFADGERVQQVQTSFATSKHRPLNVGRALQNVIACYRARMARRFHPHPCDDGRGFCIDVPEITSCRIILPGSDSVPLFPEVASLATQDQRRGTFKLRHVVAEARDRGLPLLASGDALDLAKLIARRYQRAAARHLLAHPDLIAKFRAIKSLVHIRRIAMYTPDRALNPPRAKTTRNQFMRRARLLVRSSALRTLCACERSMDRRALLPGQCIQLARVDRVCRSAARHNRRAARVRVSAMQRGAAKQRLSTVCLFESPSTRA